MIRLQAPLVFIVFVALLLGASIFIVRADMQTALQEDADAALRTAAVAAEQSARLDEASLLAKAQLVASSAPLYDALTSEPPAAEAAEGEEAPERDIEGERHLLVHEKLEIGAFVLGDLAKREAALRNIERGPLSRAPHQYEVFMVLDAKGVGVAALGKDLYSWFGDDVGKQFPIVGEVLKAKGIDQIGDAARIDYWHWSFNPGDEKKLYRVAVVPVRRSFSDEPVGVVVLGNSINDGLAVAKRDLFAGNTETETTFSEAGAEVAFVSGSDVAGSSLDSAAQKSFAASLAEQGEQESTDSEVLSLDVEGRNFSGIRRKIGQSSAGEVLQIVVLLDQEMVAKPLENVQVSLIFVGVLVLLFGTVLITFLIIRWMRPLEQLETGLQEILAGNKDYVWEPQAGHSIQESLAQGLNLVSAFLQGKQMPDEEATGSNWAGFMGGDANGGGGGGGAKPKVGGVAIPGMEPPPREDDQTDE